MEIKYYRFGDVIFRVETPVALKEDPRFEAFVVEPVEDADYVYQVLPQETGRIKGVVCSREGNRITAHMDVSYLPGITVGNLFGAAQTSLLMPEKDAFILHCSYVLHEGKAILFCAPSETGKSTQAAFWSRCRDSMTVNEDRALITFRDGTCYANGCWATGTARTCHNVSVPIRAVVLLGQGPQNRVYSLRPSEKISRILPQCSFDDRDPIQCRKIICLVSDLVAGTTVVGFDCIKDESAVDELEKCI